MTLSSLLNDENFISPIIISLKVAVSATILSFVLALYYIIYYPGNILKERRF